jgi:type II secretory pathway pseudopilin PulG
MTEMLIVIGIVMVVIIYLLSKFLTATNKVDSSKVVDTVNSIQIGVNQMFSTSGGDYSTLTGSDIVSLVPKSMINGAKVVTPWYGSNSTEIKVAPANANKQFTVTLNDLPSAACQAIGANYLNGVADSVSAAGTVVTGVTALNGKCAENSKATLILTFH